MTSSSFSGAIVYTQSASAVSGPPAFLVQALMMPASRGDLYVHLEERPSLGFT